MKTKLSRILWGLLPFFCSCEPASTVYDGPAVVNLNDSSVSFADTVQPLPGNLKEVWRKASAKLSVLPVPSRIECKGLRDSVQFELSAEQQKMLIPKNILTQKDPVVSSLYNLVVEGDTVGTIYRIHYPVVYDRLNDITDQVLLVLYHPNGHYIDYKTLAINDYGTGYSSIKSLQEIVYLYSSEQETVETDITIYDVSNKVSIRRVNTMHFSSRGSQEEYEKNNRFIDKLMN